MSRTRTTIPALSLACIAAAGLLAGCGSTTATDQSGATEGDTGTSSPTAPASSAPAGSTPVAPAPSSTTSAPATQDGSPTSGTTSPTSSPSSECRAGDLSAAYVNLSAGAGHRYGELKLTNTSAHPCTTGGYGGLSYVGGGGRQIGAAADRDKGMPATVIRLAPGQSVVSQVQEAAYGSYPSSACRPQPVDGFRVFVPDETHALFVPLKNTTTCSNGSLHLLSHKAYARG